MTAYLGVVPSSYPFLKGHGTENDFVLLPDHDGSVHGDLAAARVTALCDRRAGIGGDGVLRVIRTAVVDPSQAADAEWYMDYRNADGSLSEMCGNGIRLFARHLVDEGLADPRGAIPIATRDGVKLLTVEGDRITADLGNPKVLGETMIGIGDRCWPARHVDMGNPHAVVFVDDLSEAGPLLEPPVHDTAVFPQGVNVEFVVRRVRPARRDAGPRARIGRDPLLRDGRLCRDGRVRPGRRALAQRRPGLPGRPARRDAHGHLDLRRPVLLTGPAVVVARGTTSL